MLVEAVARARAELLEVQPGFGHADDRHVEVAAPDHGLQRREDLLVGQVAGGAEEHQRVGLSGCGHHGRLRGFRLLLDVAAELEAHRREQLVGEVGLAARAEALEQRGR